MAQAYFSKAQRSELERKIFKTEQHLKKSITKDLELAVGVKEILVDVDIDVNRYQVYKEVATIDESWKKIEEMQLPSLFIDQSQQRELKEVKEIEIEHILPHIKSIKLLISSPYDIVDKEAMNKKIKMVLASNYDKADQVKIEIEYDKSQQLLVDNRKKSLTTPQYMNVINDFKGVLKEFGPYVLGGIGILFLGFLMFLWFFKKSMGDMVSAIDDIEVKGNLTASIASDANKNLPALEQRTDRMLSSGSGGNISSYIELLEKIRCLVKKNKDLVDEMIILHFKLGEVSKILVLLNILDNKEREDIYKKIPANHLKDLKEFVVNDGEYLYRDEEKLNNIAQEIFRVISIAMVKPESFYQIYLKKIIISLSAVEIAKVIRACTKRELMYFLENVDGVKLAFVTATQDLSHIEFNNEKVELSNEEVKKFVHKLAKFIYVKDAMVEGNGNANLIPHLSSEMEEKYIKSMGISPEFKFKNLIADNIEFVNKYVKKLSFEEINDILALFNEEERKHFISVLPELVGERLVSRSFEPNENTFKLKIDLYNQLKAEHLKTKKQKIEEVNNQLEYIEEEYKKIEQDPKLDVTDEKVEDESDADEKVA